MARITINGITLDPVTEAAGLRSVIPDPEDVADTKYVLVQTRRPVAEQERARLTDLGVKIQQYVPENTYKCRYEPDDLGPVLAEPYVAWAGRYLPDFKLPATLRPTGTAVTASVVPSGDRRSPSRKPREVDVVLHEDVDPRADQVLERIGAAARLDLSEVRPGRHKVRLTVEEGRLPDLADLDEIHHLEPVPARQLRNEVARTILRTDAGPRPGRYQGADQVIAVADTGFDLGTTSDVHPAFSGRVKALHPLGRRRADDPDGHGTHVAGSVLGDGPFAGATGPAPNGSGRVRGTAPKATLVLQSLLDAQGGLGGIPDDLHDLFEPPYEDDGARVHTNSWGAVVPGLPYDSSAFEIDDTVWNRPDLAICFAAGNDGTDRNADGTVDRSSIGSESAAKNAIVVGASESDRPEFRPTYGAYWPTQFPAAPITTDRQANRPAGMAAFSSRGPTRERRIRPDVVAPGTCILSTRSRAVVNPPTDFGTSADDRYFFLSGTSMATPLVAGTVATLREALVDNGFPRPSAALLKAVLLNGATELAGQYTPTEVGPSPNNNAGFGRVDFAGSMASVQPESAATGGAVEGGPLRQGETNSARLDVPAGSTLKITLVWTDPPGEALQNDLDLIVRSADGHERHGNMGTSTEFDRVNNVEQVVWPDVPAGGVEVAVTAFRITTDAQPYAYAWRAS
ncbi:Subtilase family protein [Parafrankia irregularis]|uniref:Subtilase family protein n=1 Tax=Parafrankia irregularis TaxID=795642 RepID=A0A0S4QN67_9ACTN|nr:MULTISPECIES: S8 family serine peptidase [Parafrankia]MBE3201299.1 S8 family serine peptidase [Parafrankia sp. CH37]CUU56252.1 Subtilase family protein [Parafrankia irregularis]